ncbi:MAG: RND family transporter [Christensenellales bacterium]
MKKVAKFIVKHKILILGLAALLVIASVVAMLYVNVNSDILSYLPDGYDMTEGMNFMRENFDMQGDAIIGVADVDYATMVQITDQIKAEQGIKDGGVIWLGMILDMVENGGAMSDVVAGLSSNEDVLNLFYPKRQEGEPFTEETKLQKGNYMVMLQLNVPTSSDEALGLIEKIDNEILKDYEHAIGGSTQMTREIFDSTIGEIWKYILVAVLVMFIILLCTTTSLVEPFIFMLTLGISILINMGTNIILPSVSVVTFASSAILQLGLSMDYAIFLMHAYAEECQKTLDETLAMERAIPKTFATISSSALTTVFGFLALFFMKFEIGADLGLVLAKGVFLSLITVIIVQPCLMLVMTKLHKKTTHKIYLPKLKSVASFSVRNRKIIVIVALLLIVPCVIMQSKLNLSYIKFTYDDGEKTEIEQTVDSMSNSVIVIVPVNATKNYAFLDQLKTMDNITATLGLYSMIPENYGNLLGMMLENNISLPSGFDMASNFANNGYTMYSIMVDCEAESEEASQSLAQIRAMLDDNFGSGNYYITGMSQAVEDLKEITPRDNMVVNIVSVLMIFAVLIIALRSIKLPVLLIAVIELGIFINLSISYIMGQSVNFMAYIIISSIELGATVDYAILYTVKYKRYLDVMPAKEAAYRALRDSGVSILTSVAIMAGCCLSVALVTSNRIVGEITMMIARGSVISGLLVLFVLPALLVVTTGNRKLKKEGKRASRILRKQAKQEQQELTVQDSEGQQA